jgi:hypothetical protein
LIRVKAGASGRRDFFHQLFAGGGSIMSTGTAIVVAGITAAFLIFAAAVAFVDQWSKKKP